jgi:hypothetical protein
LSVRGRKRGRPVGKCDRKYDDEWCPEKSRTSRGRKRGRPPGSTKSPVSLPSPVRKSIRASAGNKGQLQDTDKGIEKEVSTITQKKTNKLRGIVSMSKVYQLSERPLLVGEISAKFCG